MAKAPPPATADTPATEQPSRSRPVWQLGLMIAGVAALTGGGVWYLVTPEPPTPVERLTRALDLLDADRDHQAREIVEALEQEGLQSVDFAGGVEYALGLCHFREATRRSPTDAPAAYSAAIVYLREAIRRGVPAERMPALTFALGSSLYRVGDRVRALPLLVEASHPENPQHVDAALDLTQLYLDPSWQSPERLQSALQLNDLVLGGDLSEELRTRAREQRVEVHLALQQFEAADQLVEELSVLPGRHQATLVLRSRVLIGQQQYMEAIKLLESVARENHFDRTFPRQACYLMGLASELRASQLGAVIEESERNASAVAGRAEYHQRAIEYYRKTVNRFEKTDEALAAHVRLGRIQQADGAFEKAIQSYGMALKGVRQAEEFTNAWISLEEFRQRILAAWNGWLQAGRFPEAIALADLMTPAFPRDQAYELAARARQRWAELSEENLSGGTATERRTGAAECFRLWRESAAAYERLAQARRSAANYPEAVWQAADHYYRGHDFQAALRFVDQFLVEASAAMRPVALVRRGQILMDLDRIAEAEQNFRLVRKEHPSSPAAFTAAYQLAVARMEQDDIAGAEAALRSILSSSELAPAAVEWRDSLLLLAKLLGSRAGWARRQIESQTVTPAEVKSLWSEVRAHSQEATELLEQYVSRYSESPALAEAQYNLGKALQLQSDVWRQQGLAAETENAREQSRTEMQAALQRALRCFQQVRDTLAPAAEIDRLTPTQHLLLSNAWFELPHTLYGLERYQEAITAYAATVNRFPQDVRVLTAYVQMAESYARLNRPVEARSMLEQAKVILDQDQIPTTAFNMPTTSLSRVEWEQWLDRARQVHRD